MVNLILKWLLLGLSLVLVAHIVPGIYVQNFGTALLAGIVIGLINVFIGPILKLLTLPLSVMTFGLFLWVINAFLFWLTSLFVPGFQVHTVLAALFGSLLLTMIHTVLNLVLGGLIAER